MRVADSFAFTVQIKSSRTVILGVHWLTELEVLVVTNHGLEVFEVRARRPFGRPRAA